MMISYPRNISSRGRTQTIPFATAPGELTDAERKGNLLLAGHIKMNHIVRQLADGGFLASPLFNNDAIMILNNPWQIEKKILIVKGDSEESIVANIDSLWGEIKGE